MRSIPEELKRAVDWQSLRHDRERQLYTRAFWEGVEFALPQVESGYFARRRLQQMMRERKHD